MFYLVSFYFYFWFRTVDKWNRKQNSEEKNPHRQKHREGKVFYLFNKKHMNTTNAFDLLPAPARHQRKDIVKLIEQKQYYLRTNEHLKVKMNTFSFMKSVSHVYT